VYIKFKDINKSFILLNCLYIPELGINLISQSELSSNYYIIFTKNNIYFKNIQNTIITISNKINSLYYLNIIANNKERIFILTDTIINNKDKLINNVKDKLNKLIDNLKDKLIDNLKDKLIDKDKNPKFTINKIDLYKRLGHISLAYLDHVINNTTSYKHIISNNTINKDILEYKIYLKAKFTNKINKLSSNKEFDILEKITSDLYSLIIPVTYNKYKYFITFLDKKTRFLEIKLLKTKDKAYNSFIEFKQKEENNKDNKRIRIYATDNRTEFINNKFKLYLVKHSITH